MIYRLLILCLLVSTISQQAIGQRELGLGEREKMRKWERRTETRTKRSQYADFLFFHLKFFIFVY